MRCIILTTPRGFAGQDLCWQHQRAIASARESRHDGHLWKKVRPARRRYSAVWRTHFEPDFRRTAAPADRYLTGSFHGQTLTPASFFSGRFFER
jgi:hypothetical protein